MVGGVCTTSCMPIVQAVLSVGIRYSIYHQSTPKLPLYPCITSKVVNRIFTLHAAHQPSMADADYAPAPIKLAHIAHQRIREEEVNHSLATCILYPFHFHPVCRLKNPDMPSSTTQAFVVLLLNRLSALNPDSVDDIVYLCPVLPPHAKLYP